MTREDIEQAWHERCQSNVYHWADPVDFAVDMVRRHNEECAKIAEEYGMEGEAIGEAICEARP